MATSNSGRSAAAAASQRLLFREAGARSRVAQGKSRRSAPRLVRLLEIIHAVSAETGLTPDLLARRLKVSRRRIFQDLGVICRAGIKIAFGPDGYRILTKPGPVLPVPLREDEIEALALSLSTGAPDVGAVGRARRKVASGAPEAVRGLMANGRLSAEASSTAADGVIFRKLHEATAEGKAVRIEYASASSGHGVREVHPHGIYFRGTGWYMAAYDPGRRGFRNFRVDRVARAQCTGKRFERQPGFDLGEHLSKFLEAWQGGWLGARIWVEAWAAPYIESEARARKLKFRRTQGGKGGILEIDRGHVDEVAWLVLRFPGGLRAMSPPSLRRRVIELARSVLKVHAEAHGPGERTGSPDSSSDALAQAFVGTIRKSRRSL